MSKKLFEVHYQEDDMNKFSTIVEADMEDVVFVGDVHARPELVAAAIATAAGRPMVFVGDIFDGEGGAQGAKDCLDLIRAAGAEMVLGNHELYPLFAKDKADLIRLWSLHYEVDEAMANRIWEEWMELRALLTEDDLEWLRSRPLWIKGRKWIAVHAQLPKGRLPARFVTKAPTLAQIALVDGTKTDNFWAQDYDGRHGMAIVGHTRRSKLPGYKCSWESVRLIDWDAKKGGPGCLYVHKEDNMSEIFNQPEQTPPPPPLETTGVNPHYTEQPMKNKKSRPPKDIVMRKSKSPRPKDIVSFRMSRRQRRRLLHAWRKRAGIRFAGRSVPRPKAEYIYTEKYKLPGGRRSGPPAYIHVASTASARKRSNGSGSIQAGPAFNTAGRRQAALDRKRHTPTRPKDEVKVEVGLRKAETKRGELAILRTGLKTIVTSPVAKVVLSGKRRDDYLDATRLVKAAFGTRPANTGLKTLDKAARTARRAATAQNASAARLKAAAALDCCWATQNPAEVARQRPAAKAARLAVEAGVKMAEAAALAKGENDKKALMRAKDAGIRAAIAIRLAEELSEARAATSAAKAKAKAKAKTKAVTRAKAGITVVTTVAPVAKKATTKVKVVVVVMTNEPAAKPAAKAPAKAPAKPRLGTGCSFVSMPHNLRKEIAVVKSGRPTAPAREHAQVTMTELKEVAKFRKPVVAAVEAESRPSLLLRLFELLPAVNPVVAAVPATPPVILPVVEAESRPSLLLRLFELLPAVNPAPLTIEQTADLFIDVVFGKKTEPRNDIQVSRKINHGIVNCAKVAKGVNQ